MKLRSRKTEEMLKRAGYLGFAVAVLALFLLQAILANGTGGADNTNGADEVKSDFIGAKKCKMCHKKEAAGAQFSIWEESKHAKAFELLGSEEALKVGKELGIENPQTSGKCLVCHSTAYNFTEELAKNIAVKKKDESPRLPVAEGVSCESCHWAGSKYQKKKIMQDHDQSVAAGMNPKPKESCVKCHNDKNPTWDPEKYTLKDSTKSGFDFDQAWDKIKHLRPEAE